MVKKLLIIGASNEQLQVYKTAKKMGLFVIGTDKNPNASAFRYADAKLICSTRNAKETLETVIKYTKKNTISDFGKF